MFQRGIGIHSVEVIEHRAVVVEEPGKQRRLKPQALGVDNNPGISCCPRGLRCWSVRLGPTDFIGYAHPACSPVLQGEHAGWA